jgi:hypothetical protein
MAVIYVAKLRCFDGDLADLTLDLGAQLDRYWWG